jgi:hypothetical protein
MRSIVISGLTIAAKSTDGATPGCGGNWLILKAYTTGETYTAYAVDNSTQNSLYLGWKYPSPKVNGGDAAGAGYVAYNSGIALQIVRLSSTSGTCTATAIGSAVDVSGATCVMTGSSEGDMTATVTLGDNGGGAGYGVLAGAVQKITVETSGSAPSGYASTTVS